MNDQIETAEIKNSPIDEERFHFENLKGSAETPLFVIDLFMVLLVAINLSWIVFDSLFSVSWFQQALQYVTPGFSSFYESKIHHNFFEYDLYFVVVFLTELIIRWGIAVKRETYHRWFFYPFVHWYDVLGCIPIGGFRFLRFLRVISILYRLQKMGVIDIRNSPFYPFFEKYFDVLVEEVSDRVVVNVLEGVQREVSTGNPIVTKINEEVIKPKLDNLLDTIDQDLGGAVRQVFYENETEIKDYLSHLVAEKLGVKEGSKERLNKARKAMSRRIAHTILFEGLKSFVDDLGKSDQNQLREILVLLGNSLKEQHLETLSNELTLTLIEVIEKIKDGVQVQQWKLREAEELSQKVQR
jgi:hypothetical protein